MKSVVVEDYKLQTPKIYFQTKKQVLLISFNLNCWLSLVEKDQRFYLRIFSNRYLKKGERERKEAMEENRAYNVRRLKEILEQQFTQKTDQNSSLLSVIDEETRRDCRLFSPADECPICGGFIEKRYRLFCGHYFCNDCLKGHVESSNSSSVTCPAGSDCNQRIYLVDLINVMNQEDLRKLFLKKLGPFLQTHPTEFKHCPSTNCDNILINHREIGSVIEYCKNKRLTDDHRSRLPADLKNSDNGMMDASYADPSIDKDKAELEVEEIIRESMQAEQPEEEDPSDQQEAAADKKKRLLVFCECCGHDYCFNCLKNHYETECEVDQVVQVASPHRRR